MGIFSSEKISNLYWLGRYLDRTQSALKLFMDYFDLMIDGDKNTYRTFCQTTGIPDVYADKADFIHQYPFDTTNPHSVISNVNRAFDNAVVMRDTLGSDTLAYLQMVLYDLRSAESNEERLMIGMQNAIDHLLAFWGCLDDMVDDEATRNTIKLGKQVEHLELDLRLKRPRSCLQRDYKRLENRLLHSFLPYDQALIDTIEPMLLQDSVDHENALMLLHQLLVV
ncbi:MAG: alpha-E domain-containing protein [Peptococcaceae bacterium]|jgi:uncharacterized alpha-E superfamily protein|nr:alpha-E domain-containing protein [Peptococcaceae bacterium]